MPSYLPFMLAVRRRILGMLLRQELEGVVIEPFVFIGGYRGLKLGKYVSLNHNCYLSCDGGLEIGDYTGIGHGTSIHTTSHNYEVSEVPSRLQPVTYAPVRIGANVLVSANCTILHGVTIADGTVVATGSVVSTSIETPDTLVASIGAARSIKKRPGKAST